MSSTVSPEPAVTRPLNLLLWHWGRRGGGPRYTFELARALARLDGVNTHLSLSRQSELYDISAGLGLPTHTIDTYTDITSALMGIPRLPVIASAFAHYLNENNIDVVVCTMAHIWDLAMLRTLRSLNIPLVLTLHDAVPHPGEGFGVRGWMLRRQLAAASAFICLTNHVHNDALALGVTKSHTPSAVIPMGVFAYGPQREQPRTFPQNRKFRFLFFGRLQKYKGLDLLIEAFRVANGINPNTELRIVGNGSVAINGLPENAKIERRWVPEDEIATLMDWADALVLPYTECSQSGIVPVAAWTALPSIGFAIGGLAEQIEDSVNGSLVWDLSADALGKSMAAMSVDPDGFETCSQGALELAKGPWNWRAIADQVLDLVASVSEAKRG